MSDELNREAAAIACRVMADTKYKQPYMSEPDATPHLWVVEAVLAGIRHGKFIAEQQHQLIEQGQADEHEGMSTSLIRAGMAAVCEAVLQYRYVLHGANRDESGAAISVTINLEAQRTIWDRVELTTDRNADETEVIFTVTRK